MLSPSGVRKDPSASCVTHGAKEQGDLSVTAGRPLTEKAAQLVVSEQRRMCYFCTLVPTLGSLPFHREKEL